LVELEGLFVYNCVCLGYLCLSSYSTPHITTYSGQSASFVLAGG